MVLQHYFLKTGIYLMNFICDKDILGERIMSERKICTSARKVIEGHASQWPFEIDILG